MKFSIQAKCRFQTIELIPGFLRACESDPDKAAFILDQQVTSYARLQQLVDVAARDMALYAQSNGGLQHRLHIAVATENCIEIAVWYLFAAQEGHMLCLLDPDWPDETMAYALDLYQPDVLVSHTLSQADWVTTSFTSEATTTLANTTTRAVTVSMRDRYESANDDEAVLADMFFAGFTSGSTGLPKAFVRTAHSWVVSIKAAADEFETHADSVLLAPGPLSHGLSFFTLVESLYHGATFVSQSRFSATRSLALLCGGNVAEKENALAGSAAHEVVSATANVVRNKSPVVVTAAILVPSMLHAILEKASEMAGSIEPRQADSKSIRVITAGAKLDASHSRLFEINFPLIARSEYYGASELSFITVSHAQEGIDPSSVGRPFKSVELLIKSPGDMPDPEAGFSGSNIDDENSDSSRGTVLVKSSMIASGYLQRGIYNDKSTLEITPLSLDHGMATVNDRGYIDAAGHLFLLDREDRMIKSRGFKVYPLVVEAVMRDYFLNSFEGDVPAEIVVVGMADDFHGMTVVAIHQAELHRLPEFNKHKKQLIEYCRKFLKTAEVPSRLFLSPSLPMTSSGKVAYRQLQRALTEHVQNDLQGRGEEIFDSSYRSVEVEFSCREF